MLLLLFLELHNQIEKKNTKKTIKHPKIIFLLRRYSKLKKTNKAPKKISFKPEKHMDYHLIREQSPSNLSRFQGVIFELGFW